MHSLVISIPVEHPPLFDHLIHYFFRPLSIMALYILNILDLQRHMEVLDRQ